VVRISEAVLALLIFAGSGHAQTYYTYVGNLRSDSVLLAWGTADGRNTIGRSSPSKGSATIRINDKIITTRVNWTVVGGLKPETDYPYEIAVDGRLVGRGLVHTWPERSTKLVFFVIGDFGNASKAQYAIANAMWKEFERRQNSGNPVRFVLTAGDNIYGDLATFLFGFKNTGNKDSDWASKFFEPYQPLLERIPFYPTLGNHDGNETEHRGDLDAYLDNFFFPSDNPSRYYSFQFGGLAEFFALDSTMNTESGSPRPAWLSDGPQFQWMSKALPSSTAPWKIAYYHHPVFSAGPRHAAAYHDLKHWIDLFQRSGVQVAFNGHEHNFQYSKVNALSGGVRFVTSGAGGELRAGNVMRNMDRANIEGWAPTNNFLVVEIEGKTMRITPLGFDEVVVRNAQGAPVQMPIVVTIP
jgi:tartrate-resistant acid phosphatase type 5